MLSAIDRTDFLQALTLLHTHLAGRARAKRPDLLDLPLSAWKMHASKIEKGFVTAAQLLVDVGHVYDADLLPYGAQLIPLAVICTLLGDRLHDAPVREKVMRWYWCGVFGELYGSATDTRFVLDIQQVPAWIDGGVEPDTVRASSFPPTRLLSMRTRNSAAYKGLMALSAGVGARDWVKGEALSVTRYLGSATHIHHIFPRAWSKTQSPEPREAECAVNKTLLSDRTNELLRGDAPSVYLARMERNHGINPEDMDRYLRSHLIDPEFLRADDYHEFFTMRARRLLDLVSAATGREIPGRESDEVRKAYGATLPPAPPYPAEAPPLFGKYRELTRLGTFGMSDCFKVRAPDGQVCFLKRAPIEGYDAQALSREQSIYAKLERERCEAVLRVIDYERDDHHAALVLEWADGGTLADLARTRPDGRFGLDEARDIATRVLDALAELHALGIVHRDIKPANVLRVGEVWKLGDFGIARNLNRVMTLRTFQGAGTPGYAPKEQLEGASADATQDVHAIGQLLRFLLTGSIEPGELPRGWSEMVTACTAERPEERPSVGELRKAVAELGA